MNKTLVWALVATLIAVAILYWTQNQAAERSSATAAPDASQRSGKPLAEVMHPAALSAQTRQGEVYYNAVCASCHGTNAAGQDGIAPPLVHRIYEPSHHGDEAFVLAARNGVPAHHWSFGDMPPVAQPLTDAELDAIVAYVRELQRANGIN